MRIIDLFAFIVLVLSLTVSALLFAYLPGHKEEERLEMLEQRVKILEKRVIILEHPEMLLKPKPNPGKLSDNRQDRLQYKLPDGGYLYLRSQDLSLRSQSSQ